MRRLFINEPLAERITITGQDAHHIGYSLRSKAGDRLTIVDTNGEVAVMEIKSFTADTVDLGLVERIIADTESPIELTLAMCLPKADKMDFIVQKATELGAVAVQPLRSANCVVKYDEKKCEARREKWQRIADEAVKQCGRTAIPQIKQIMDLTDWLKTVQNDESLTAIMCYEAEDKLTIGRFLNTCQGKKYAVLIGPEGGFSLGEVEAAEQAGVACVTLGPRILKAETAAVTTLSIVQHIKGDLGAV